ncbi:DUF2812 domain-containing protein [Virgibacillus halodenitrificans]|uniref:DUF2812 domain-containing protein n=1 Tax=Virgibacillus halodenitrificans TaxID=1482 RepID=UPI00136C6F14|nr:DUF2812 domain-containing protein [Virgibacillus halodenitrificans]MYL44292.1 DUF2812 domain-containing protein [Virgibacillus halodenitrificans]
MKQTKYITSGGLAFSEYKDMEKLRRYSLKGWHVSDFKFMGYTLKRGESSDYIYSIDYRWLKEGEEEEYFSFFSTSGWSYVASEGNIHLFRAKPGAKPIYTDRDTTVEKYGNSIGFMGKLAIPLFLLTALVWVGAMMSPDIIKSILIVAAVILGVITIPTAGTVIATYHNKWKAEGRKGLVILVKFIPFLLLLTAVIILLFFGGTGTTVNILASMVIGAIAFPTAIWGIIFLYHIVGKKRG